jgi:hypothetical protein
MAMKYASRPQARRRRRRSDERGRLMIVGHVIDAPGADDARIRAIVLETMQDAQRRGGVRR